MKKVNVKIGDYEWNCDLEKHKYPNGRTALVLTEDGEDIIYPTTNLPHVQLNPDEVLIKNYSENEGIYEQLLDQGIISPTIEMIPTGWVEVHKVKLLV